ncbi:MAG: penicillin-binding protein 1C [Spirochaetales bacterium]|nr:penicillin-binding protein 1C [Spirochaetales bacterium]
MRSGVAWAGFALFSLALMVEPRPPIDDALYSAALYARGEDGEASGELLGARVADDGQWRLELSATVPDRFARALVLYEDKRYYGHAGFDPYAIIRAAWYNARAGVVVSGGSTIPMQVARLSRAPGERNVAAKLVELWMAIRLEWHYDKASLIDLYALLAPFGGNVVGLEAAGFRWFGRAPDQLTWAEAATLAVLPNSPGLVHPGRARDALTERRDGLLERLAEAGAMSGLDRDAAFVEPLPLEPRPMPGRVPHLVAVAPPGRSVTTLESALQARVEQTVERHARNLGRSGVGNVAAVVLRVADGSVAAYVGNSSALDSAALAPELASAPSAPWVDCALAPRSSGSILKPFLYAAMIDSGELSPSRLIPDIPTRVGSYSPENNLKSYTGAVRADEALARSLNVPFVRLLRSYGVERFASLLKRVGFTTLHRAPADYGLTLILGGAETTLLDAASAYAKLACAAGGGNAGETDPCSAGAAWLTLEALVDVARPGQEASWQEYASSRRIAWKTGTSFGSRDAWAIGVTPEYTVAVWAGNADGSGRPELRGTDAAAPVLFEIFQLLPLSSWFAEPHHSLRVETVCAHSGYVAGPDCVETERVLVPAGAKTDTACPYCRLVALSSDGRYRVRAEAAGEFGLTLERRFVLPPAMEWYFERSTIGYKALPPWAPGAEGYETGAMEFMSPEAGSSLFVPIELDGSPGKAVFRVAHRDRRAKIYWHLDGEYLGESVGDHRMEARPFPGTHELVVVDATGSSASLSFEVYARE